MTGALPLTVKVSEMNAGKLQSKGECRWIGPALAQRSERILVDLGMNKIVVGDIAAARL